MKQRDIFGNDIDMRGIPARELMSAELLKEKMEEGTLECKMCNDPIETENDLYITEDGETVHGFCRGATAECDCCLEEFLKLDENNEEFLGNDGWREVSAYDSPFDDEPRLFTFCSDDCEFHFMREPDFAYIYCPECGREVCEQNPSNGWHVQVKYLDCGEIICLACYEEMVLRRGQEREEFEGDNIKGGMFFNYADLEKAGFQKHSSYFIKNKEDADQYNQKDLELIDKGYKVVTDFESMAIGGLEGTVGLWYRKG